MRVHAATVYRASGAGFNAPCSTLRQSLIDRQARRRIPGHGGKRASTVTPFRQGPGRFGNLFAGGLDQHAPMRDDVRRYLRDLLLIIASVGAGLGAISAAHHMTGPGMTLLAGLVDSIVLAEWLWVMKKTDPTGGLDGGLALPIRRHAAFLRSPQRQGQNEQSQAVNSNDLACTKS
jgi:hypothetical protein